MMTDKLKKWKRIVSRFKGKLIEMLIISINLSLNLLTILGPNGAKFDNYSISPKIRKILLHWGYELVESDLL